MWEREPGKKLATEEQKPIFCSQLYSLPVNLFSDEHWNHGLENLSGSLEFHIPPHDIGSDLEKF